MKRVVVLDESDAYNIRMFDTRRQILFLGLCSGRRPVSDFISLSYSLDQWSDEASQYSITEPES